MKERMTTVKNGPDQRTLFFKTNSVIADKRKTRHLFLKGTKTFFFILFQISAFGQSAKLDTSNLEATMRNPAIWERADYIKSWLLLGPVPATWNEGMDSDFLAKAGGETAINPREGQYVKIGNKELQWQLLAKPGKTIDLARYFKGGLTENVACYAFGIVKSETARHTILSVGSDDAVKMWLNGKMILRNHIYRGVDVDQDLVEADLNKGDNFILLKILNGSGGWAFAFRTMEDAYILEKRALKPVVWINHYPEKSVFTIHSSTLTRSLTQQQPLKVELYAAGGKPILAKTIQRGDSLVVATGKLSEGIYEIKYTYAELEGTMSSGYMNWVKGDLPKMAREVVETAPKGNASAPEEITHRMLADLIMDRLGGTLTHVDPSAYSVLYSPLMEFAEMKTKKQIRPGGFVRLAYIDDIDGTPQFCRCYIPPDYDPARKTAMVVYLHGYNQENPEYIKSWSVDKRHDTYADRYNYILIEPHGRGNTQYTGIGDHDVVKCIQLAQEKLNVDDNRIYLTGESMGGGGTWKIASVHPELFAAIAPVYGGWDLHNNVNKEVLQNLSDKDEFVLEKSYTTTQFESLLNTPILALHGDNDKTVSVENTRYLVRMLQRWGYDIRYIEVPGKGHEQLGMGDVIYPWLLGHTLEKYPKKVRLRAADLRTASAFWVKVDEQTNGWKMMNVEAEVLPGNIIRINSENVLSMILSPGEKLIRSSQPVRVIWNGEIQTFDKVNPYSIPLVSKEVTALAKVHKTPQLAGPIGDFTNTPYAIVVGTIARDNEMRRSIRFKADGFRAYWRSWQKYNPVILTDTLVTEADLKKYSLFLFGGPKENKVTQQLSKDIPFVVTDSTVAIGENTFRATDAFLEAVYPNPYNSDRYIRLVAPTSVKGLYFYNATNLEFSNVDYCIVDGVIPNPAIKEANDKIRIASGLFNYNWKTDTSAMNKRDEGLAAGSAKFVFDGKMLIDVNTKASPGIDLLNSYTGTFQVEKSDIRVEIMTEDNKLMFQLVNGPRMVLIPISKTEFISLAANIIMSFQKEPAKNTVFINLYQGGSYQTRLTKL